jgi:diacylglycerol kinase family enzyme
MKICAFYNTAASQALNEDLRPLLDAHFKDLPVFDRYDFEPEEHDFNALVDKALKKADYDTILFIGGDGTLRSGVNYVHQQNLVKALKVVFIPYGTGNLMRDALGLPADNKTLLKSVKEENFQSYRYAIFNEEVFLVAASVGNISALAEINQWRWFKRLFGRLSYVLKLMVSAPSFRNKKFKVRLEGKTKTIEAHSVLVSLGDFLGGFMQAPAVADSKLCIIFLSFGTDCFKLIKSLFVLLLSGKFPKPEVYELSQIVVEGEGLSAVQIDGDIVEVPLGQKLNFTMAPEPLHILRF